MRCKIKSITLFLFSIAACNSSSKTEAPKEETMPAAIAVVNTDNNLVGEWQQQYTCFDKNGNYKLEPQEKKPSNTRLGFDWFKFNADGSCLVDKDVKFKGTYEVKEKNGNKKLLIQKGDNLRYTLIELTGNQLILGSDGAFIVFKKIN